MSDVLNQQFPATLLPETVIKDNDLHLNAGKYKCLLNQHTQKSSNQPPIYHTYNEGAQHQPQFRSRVWIDGAWYTSPNTFSQRKAAELEVSRIAFLAIMQKQKDEGANLIRENTIFCKSILIEYAVRMNLEKPSYQTTQPDLSLPLFSSTLVFNGVTYTGEFARNKIEAQRLAARTVILSILDAESGNVMSEIINAKFKLYDAALNKAKNSSNVQVGITPGSVNTENNNGIIEPMEVEIAPGDNNNIPPPSTIIEPFQVQNTSIPAMVTTEVPDRGKRLCVGLLLHHDTIFCKSILVEYAVRMNLEKPSYQTTQPDLSLPLFSSTLVFNGVTYTGEVARNKIEAQRLAARAVILSILDTESGDIMSEIINSKFKLYTALNKAKNSSNGQVGITPGNVHTENNNGIQFSKPNEVEVAPSTNNIPPPSTIIEPHTGQGQQNTSIPAIDLLLQVFQPPKPELLKTIPPPAISLAPISEQIQLVDSSTAVVTPLHIVGPPTAEEIPLVIPTSGKKRNRKNKKKAQKKACVEVQLALDVVPLTQIAPYSVAQ